MIAQKVGKARVWHHSDAIYQVNALFPNVDKLFDSKTPVFDTLKISITDTCFY